MNRLLHLTVIFHTSLKWLFKWLLLILAFRNEHYARATLLPQLYILYSCYHHRHPPFRRLHSVQSPHLDLSPTRTTVTTAPYPSEGPCARPGPIHSRCTLPSLIDSL